MIILGMILIYYAGILHTYNVWPEQKDILGRDSRATLGG